MLKQVYRVLKPGGTLIFVQRLHGGPLQPLLGGSAGAVGACAGKGWLVPACCLLGLCLGGHLLQVGQQVISPLFPATCHPPHQLVQTPRGLILFRIMRAGTLCKWTPHCAAQTCTLWVSQSSR